MAKKENDEAQLQEQSPITEGTQEETTQQPGTDEQQVDTSSKKTTERKSEKKTTATVEEPVRKVKIHTTEDVNCIIACVPYVIPANKDAQVPADVAAILVNAQKAYRQ